MLSQYILNKSIKIRTLNLTMEKIVKIKQTNKQKSLEA